MTFLSTYENALNAPKNVKDDEIFLCVKVVLFQFIPRPKYHEQAIFLAQNTRPMPPTTTGRHSQRNNFENDAK